MLLEAENPGLKFRERFEICWSKDLPLNNRKVDFNLVEPTCVDRRVNRDNGRPSPCKSFIGQSTTMRRSVVHDPEHPLCRSIRLLPHDLINQPLKRLDSSLPFTSAEDSGAMNIPSGKVGQSASPLIFMFNTHLRARFGRECFGHPPSLLAAA